MCRRITIALILFSCLSLTISGMSNADDTQQGKTSLSPCEGELYRSFATQYSRVTFIEDPERLGSRWLCYEGKVLAETRSHDGGYYTFAFENIENEYLERRGKHVKRNDESVLLRMVVQEYTANDDDNRYWLIDFREKEPLVVGPMGGNDGSDTFSVIWNDQNVIVILDDDGTPLGSGGRPRGGYRPDWKAGEYKFVDDVSIEFESGAKLPLLNKDGIYHEGAHGKKAGKRKRNAAKLLYRAYYYDYKTKKLTAAMIQE